ncbi:reverse transcriptase domain-containing protein [Clostridium sp. HMP27]|uniref:reverse transcriptase domain-containing protein n=1 Tax=Clostridium sp. HMP27 TaxID=1487921 RepID=UPI00052D6436|nr:reverse transcriptase domain-containing protein [Clostridium sp. HMP27]KGK88052.1 DNA polymerase [Clostridium sp. HMP27]
MSKMIKNIYPTLCTYENLYNAYLEARKNKRFRNEVLEFTFNLEENLMELSTELKNKTYKISGYREFVIYDPKERLIMALPFRDRVVQWAIYQLINPTFDKSYIDDSFGCRVGKGTHSAVKRLHYWLNQVDRKPNKYYYLKLDISKYYYRVDHNILINILDQKIKGKDLLDLLKGIINFNEVPFGLKLKGDINNPDDRLYDRGMPIGNLTSQMFANLYLNELDQLCKRKLRIKHYIRYMDDVVILSEDKKLLQEYKSIIEEFLNTKLNLHLNNKTAIRPISLGVEFVGFRIWPTHIKMRKSTSLKMKRRLKYVKKQYEQNKLPFEKVNATVQSYMGIMKHCNSFCLQKKIFDSYILSSNNEE